MRKPAVVDLFCGAGGLSLGFHAAGCRIQAAVDIDESAGRTFRANFEKLQPGEPPIVMPGEDFDLEQMRLAEILRDESPPDIVIGGPHARGLPSSGAARSTVSMTRASLVTLATSSTEHSSTQWRNGNPGHSS